MNSARTVRWRSNHVVEPSGRGVFVPCEGCLVGSARACGRGNREGNRPQRGVFPLYEARLPTWQGRVSRIAGLPCQPQVIGHGAVATDESGAALCAAR